VKGLYREDELEFKFGDDWEFVPWDKDRRYLTHVERPLQGIKAVDFVALFNGSPWLIEVKDFRGHRIENKDRLKDGALAKEFAEKVGGTLAGLLIALLCEGQDRPSTKELSRYVNRLINRQQKLPVVLWMEGDRPLPAPSRSALSAQLRKELRGWLNATVIITSMADEISAPKLHNLQVVHCPAAPAPGTRET
jgi:hypothetical protein